MHLGLFIHGPGHHIAAWRDPSVNPLANITFADHVATARTAEAAGFDMLFTADSNATFGPDDPAIWALTGAAARLEPLTLLAALAAVTTHIGLVCTATTTYAQPFRVARQFASLDLISLGRAGWNVVTSSAEAEALNFSHASHAPHAQRYERAEEFVGLVKQLWHSYEPGSPAPNQTTGQFHDPATLHLANHHGANFTVRGPLSTPRSPQGQPVIVAAGQSGPGRTLAARHADVVFTVQQDITVARDLRTDMRARAAAAGRDPDSIRIMPGLLPVIADTEPAARARLQTMQELIHPEIGVKTLSDIVNLDLSSYDLDGPLPDLPPSNTQQGRQQIVLQMARAEHLTIRQLYQRVVGARGHRILCGTPESIAEDMIAWVETGAADGFNIMPLTFPQGLEDFCNRVIPLLQARGHFRRGYAGHTLRAHLGIAR